MNQWLISDEKIDRFSCLWLTLEHKEEREIFKFRAKSQLNEVKI